MASQYESLRRALPDPLIGSISDYSFPSDIAQTMASKTAADAENAIEAELARFFQPLNRSVPKDFQFSDADIRRLASLLQKLPYAQHSWSRVPRTYAVLRVIRRLEFLDRFIETDFNDYLFPVRGDEMPNCLEPSDRIAFVKAQRLVCTKSIDLEKGENGRHQIFATDQSEELFVVNKVLGSSSSSQVDHVVSSLSFEEYARKRIVRKTAGLSRSKENMSSFVVELEILKRLRHKHIVKVAGSYTDPKYFVLLLSPVADSNLSEFYPNVLRDAALKTTLRTFFGCLATALAYLHDNLVKHKDIKPQNILIHRGRVLLTDFSISRVAGDPSSVTTEGWTLKTPKYCAPEVAAYKPRGSSADIFSLGCVFLEMVSILKEQRMSDLNGFYRQTGSQELCFSANEEATDAWIEHLKALEPATDNVPLQWASSMLQQDRMARPSARQLARLITHESPTSGTTAFVGLCCNYDFEDTDFAISSTEENLDHEILGGFQDIVGANAPPMPTIVAPMKYDLSDSHRSSHLLAESELHSGAIVTQGEDAILVASPRDTMPSQGSSTTLLSDGYEVKRNITVTPLSIVEESARSAANASCMRIYKAALRYGGHQFASEISLYVHDGGAFQSDSLHRAVESNAIQAIMFLLQAGEDPNRVAYTSGVPAKPLDIAAHQYVNREHQSANVLIMLLEHGASYNGVSQTSLTAVVQKACERDSLLLEKLLDLELQLSEAVSDSHDLLRKACEQSQLAIVDVLLAHGVRHWPWDCSAKSAFEIVLESLEYDPETTNWRFVKQIRRLKEHLRQEKIPILLSLMKSGIISQEREDRLRLLHQAIRWDIREVPGVLSDNSTPLTKDEALFGMLFGYSYDHLTTASFYFWHEQFVNTGFNIFIERSCRAPPAYKYSKEWRDLEVSEADLVGTTWFTSHLGTALTNDMSVDELEKVMRKCLQNPKALLETCPNCWPMVDFIKFYLDPTSPLFASDAAEESDKIYQIWKMLKAVEVPRRTLRGPAYAEFDGSVLAAAAHYGSLAAFKVLIFDGIMTDSIDINKPILDRSERCYRSPLNIALECEDQDLIEMLQEAGARDFTTPASLISRLASFRNVAGGFVHVFHLLIRTVNQSASPLTRGLRTMSVIWIYFFGG